MLHPEDENYRETRPVFLTVLCILTFIGSGWAIFSAVTAYRTAETTISMFSDSVINKNMHANARIKDSIIDIPNAGKAVPDSLHNLTTDSLISIESSVLAEDNLDKDGVDTTTASYKMGKKFGEKMKKNVMDMMSVEKMKNSAMGSFTAALFTLAGAFFMFRLRKYGFFLYIIGILIGIVIPFYIYGNNLLAIGISAFSSFFGLIFIALYALNLKSMK